MTSVELPRVAGAVLELKLGTPVSIQAVVPVHVEVKVTGSSPLAQTNDTGRPDRHNSRGSSSGASNAASRSSVVVASAAPAAGAAIPAGSIVFEPAYLCLGQGAVWFVDRAIDDLLRPSMGPIPYTQIERVDVQKPSECPQTLCLHLMQVRLGDWAPDADKLFVRTADRTKLVSQLQLFWSISHVQTSWTLPGSSDVVIRHDVSWESRRSSLDEDTISGGMRPASLRAGGSDKRRQTDADNIAALSSNSTAGAELSAPEHEGFEQVGEYRFCVPRAGSSGATFASMASMGSQVSHSKRNNGLLSNSLRCLHLTRTSQHFNRVSYSSVASPSRQDQVLAHQSSLRRNGSHLSSSAVASRGGSRSRSTERSNLRAAWLLEIATLPVAKVAHDSYAGNASIRLLAEAELRRVTAGISEYELLDVPHTYIKKLNLGNDPAQWSCWEISARLWRAKAVAGPLSDNAELGPAAGQAHGGGVLHQTIPYSSQPTAVQCRDVNIIAMRRMFIPPFMDTLQDFVLVMFSPSITASSAVYGTGASHSNGMRSQGNGSSSDILGGAQLTTSSFHGGGGGEGGGGGGGGASADPSTRGAGQNGAQVFNARRAEITSQSLLEVSRGIADSFMPQSAQHAVDTSVAEAKVRRYCCADGRGGFE